MPTQRNWPESHTNELLDYIDQYGDSLVTAGNQRQVGYEKIRTVLNAKCIPRPKPRYTIDEINDHCQYTCRTFSIYAGPNLKAFFGQGRKYLQPPLKSEEEIEDNKDASPANANLTPRSSTLYQSRSPSRLLRIRHDTTAPSNNKLSKGRKKGAAMTHMLDHKAAPIQKLLSGHDELKELFDLRSKKHRLPFQEIAPGMIRVERNIQKAVDEYLNQGWVSSLPPPNFEMINRNHKDLAAVLQQATRLPNWDTATQVRKLNAKLLRAIIGWAVFEWVLQDPFPVFGTECGSAWEGLKEVLQERGAHDYLRYFENLRTDVQFHLSQKTQFINETLPNRALSLAEKLASVLHTLFFTADDCGKESFLSKDGKPVAISNKWVPKLQEVFLNVLDFVVKLRQREDQTEFYRPEFDTPFNDDTMQAEHNGTTEDFIEERVLMTLVPGALGHVVDRSGDYEAEVEIYYKALVVLNLKES